MNYIIIGSGRDSFAEAVRLSHAAGLLWSSCIDKAGNWCVCMDDDAPRDAVEVITASDPSWMSAPVVLAMACEAFLRAPDEQTWRMLRQCGSVIR